MLKNEKLGTLVKTSLVDFPSKVAAVMFFTGCNLRCPYCYNHAVVKCEIPQDELLSMEDLEFFFRKRQNVLGGFVASGGEALLNPHLPNVLRLAKSFGLATKLDTNGTFPEKLISLFANNETRPNYVALDVKTSLSRYDSVFGVGCEEKIRRTIDFLKTLNPTEYEFRTVLVPTLIDEKEITEIGKILPIQCNWFFSQFRAENCLNPQFNNLIPYDETKLKVLENLGKNLIPKAQIR